MATLILRWLAVAALVAAAVFAVVRAYEGWRAKVYLQGDRVGAARVRAQWDEDRAQAQAAKLETQRLDAIETKRRLAAQERSQREQINQINQAQRDAAAAIVAADGLRLRADAYLNAAGCYGRAGDTALECVRAAVAQIANALGRCGAIAQRAAADADDARARGYKCEADYDSLTAEPLSLKRAAPP